MSTPRNEHKNKVSKNKTRMKLRRYIQKLRTDWKEKNDNTSISTNIKKKKKVKTKGAALIKKYQN